MNKSEFLPEIRNMSKIDPAFIKGYFNNDVHEDFSALIVNNNKRQYKSKYKPKVHSYDYVDGMLVVCHSLISKEYQCVILSEHIVVLGRDFRFYIQKKNPGNITCLHENGKFSHMQVKTDAIGMYSDITGGQYIYQPDGSYFYCTTAD